jgi:hypothetical protein
VSSLAPQGRSHTPTTHTSSDRPGEPIKDRLISLWDPDARPIRKGKLGKPTEFGYVDQLCEITANTKRGARGFILPPNSQIGNPAEHTLLPETADELKNLDVTLKEIMLDGGFMTTPSNTALDGLDRSRLKGDTGHQIWAGRAALSYNAETYTTLR